MSEELVECPFCAEEIKAAAIKCKHCGSMIDEGSVCGDLEAVPSTAQDREVLVELDSPSVPDIDPNSTVVDEDLLDITHGSTPGEPRQEPLVRRRKREPHVKKKPRRGWRQSLIIVAATAVIVVDLMDHEGGLLGARSITATYHPNGTKSSEGLTGFRYGSLGGTRDGWWAFFHETGQKASEGKYEDGEKYGKWTAWHVNGQKGSEGNYKNNEKDGHWATWYENGDERTAGAFLFGNQAGLWTTWDEGGTKTVGSYSRGVGVGIWCSWISDGTVSAHYKWGTDSRETSLMGFNSDGTPSLMTFAFLAEEVGDSTVERILGHQSIRDFAQAVSAFEIRKSIGGREMTFDVDKDLSRFDQRVVQFEAEIGQERGAFETDLNLSQFRITSRTPTAEEINARKRAKEEKEAKLTGRERGNGCATCGGDGIVLVRKQMKCSSASIFIGCDNSATMGAYLAAAPEAGMHGYCAGCWETLSRKGNTRGWVKTDLAYTNSRCTVCW